jgi:parallel beta-helix repeat protein
MRQWRAAAAMVAMVVALVEGSQAGAATTTLFVDRSNPACSDAGSGTATQPFCTINAAAAKVTAGLTVQVLAGTYPEDVTVRSSGTSDAHITFTAAQGANVTLSGQTDGFYLSGRSWVTINGFNVTNTTGYGIAVNTSSYITLSNNHVSYSGQPISGYTKYGIRLNAITDSLVSQNTVDHNTNAGIGLVSGSTRNAVIGNVSFRNAEGYQRAAAGIHLYDAPANTVAGNISHDNEDSGINIYPGSSGCTVYDNVTYNNGDHGIDDSFAPNATIVANSVYQNVTAGINVEGGSTGATLANNVSVDNGIRSPRTHSDIRVEHGSTDGTTLDYDLVYLTTADTVLIWDSVSYTSLSAFQAASGQEAHGLQANPRWVEPTSGDFRLTEDSPAIDSANSGAPAQPALDVYANGRVDDPGTTNTGAGPRPYDDRGAIELQPGASQDAGPTPSLTVTPSSGLAPLNVVADASASTDTDATPISTYTFDFGDGTAQVGPQPAATAAHEYMSAGTFVVTVTVTDTAGLSATATTTVQTTADAAPSASLSVSPSSGVVNLNVTADGSTSTDTDSTQIASYSFDFGDGSAATGPQPSATATHTYTADGTYRVTMTVTDSAGLASTATAQVTVVDNPPSVTLKVSPTNGTAPLLVTATATATDTDATPVASYAFDFGDGSARIVQAGGTATHTYAARGSYTILVTVMDSAGLTTSVTRRFKVG